ncbi:MAG: type II secretion system protein GspG [Blastocatellia bacterium]
MKQSKMRWIVAAVLIPACTAMTAIWIVAGAAGGLDAGRARDMLRRIGGADFPKANVRVKNILPGMTAKEVIVEATIETAWRFNDTKEGWRIADVRLADRQWESIELVTEAIRREKIRRTELSLKQLADGLERYRRDHGSFVNAQDMSALLDQLAPRYVSAALRHDLWGNPFVYQGTGAQYRLFSHGPDGAAGTGDDLLMEGGK